MFYSENGGEIDVKDILEVELTGLGKQLDIESEEERWFAIGISGFLEMEEMEDPSGLPLICIWRLPFSG